MKPNIQRVTRCESALKLYGDDWDTSINLIDLLADAMHWCCHKEYGFNQLLATARNHFREEAREGKPPFDQRTSRLAIATSLDVMHEQLEQASREIETARDYVQENAWNAAVGSILPVAPLLEQCLDLHRAILAFHRFSL